MNVASFERFHRWWLSFAQGNYGGYVPPGGSPNPYAANPYGQPPPKKSRALLYILLGIGGAMLLVCGLCAGGGYFAFNQGMGMIAENTKADVQGKPVVQEHIGTIESATSDFAASIQESQKRGDTGGDSHLVIHLKGSKGSGDVIGKAPKGGGQRLVNPILRLPDGKEFPLD